MEVLYQCCHATFAQALREHDVARSAVEDRIGWQRERRVERFPQRRVEVVVEMPIPGHLRG